jgi:hypothetical protein
LPGRRSWKVIFKRALTRPFLLFAREPIIQLLGVYMAFLYGTLYCKYLVRFLVVHAFPPGLPRSQPIVFLTTIPTIFQGVYGQRVGVAGLHYLALGVGLSGASQVNARLLDRVYLYFAGRNGGRGRPEFRLRESLFTFRLKVDGEVDGCAFQRRWCLGRCCSR